MSMQDDTKDPSNQSDMSKVLEDQSFVSSILTSVSVLSSMLMNFMQQTVAYEYVLTCYWFCSFQELTQMIHRWKIWLHLFKVNLRCVLETSILKLTRTSWFSVYMCVFSVLVLFTKLPVIHNSCFVWALTYSFLSYLNFSHLNRRRKKMNPQRMISEVGITDTAESSSQGFNFRIQLFLLLSCFVSWKLPCFSWVVKTRRGCKRSLGRFQLNLDEKYCCFLF